MRVSGLDGNSDWKFGKGKADYISNDAAIRQNVSTRLKSFANDFFLDMSANIDWITILGQKNNQSTILKEIERITLATEGVMQITKLEINASTDRYAIITLKFISIFSNEISLEAGIEI